MLSCKPKFQVHTGFYFWKTEYKNERVANDYLKAIKAKSIYVRIMDVDLNSHTGEPAPVSPIVFSDPLPKELEIVPVAYLVNRIFYNITEAESSLLANRIARFVDAKVKQAGKSYQEIQIDCDWTQKTRDHYFSFLKQLQTNPVLANKRVSVTLRLHQVKNQSTSGIPPVQKALLMCYNMGNLRKFGTQNSILDLNEMNIYLKDHLADYPLKLDVALPLFNWAVVFRQKQYAGISRRIGKQQIQDPKLFEHKGQSLLYELRMDYPQAGLKRGDLIRWEEISLDQLLASSDFLSRYLKPEERNILFYHLDTDLLKTFTHDDLEKVIDNF